MAKLGQKVAVRYRGTLAKNGKVFDETKGNKTFTFRLGELPLAFPRLCLRQKIRHFQSCLLEPPFWVSLGKTHHAIQQEKGPC